MEKRDPRTDPRPGDILLSQKVFGLNIIDVDDEHVTYTSDKSPGEILKFRKDRWIALSTQFDEPLHVSE